MTKDELWLSKYNVVKAFTENNHKNPFRHRIEDLLLLNWLNLNRKLLNSGKLKEDRIEMFEKLLELAGVCDTIKKIIQIIKIKRGNGYFTCCPFELLGIINLFS